MNNSIKFELTHASIRPIKFGTGFYCCLSANLVGAFVRLRWI